MPSWNIHTAHVERLVEGSRLDELGIRNFNAFLFGNLVPDVYVGYMVVNPTRKIEYKDTHLANPAFIPTPDASAFYERYVRDHEASDVTLGAWCHLLCDHYYNRHTIAFIESVGVAPGEQTRIRKQGDFDLFGRTLNISRVPVVDGELVAQCAAFEQYAVDEADVRASVEVAARIVRNNREHHVSGEPSYSLLTKEFFAATFAEVDDVLHKALVTHAQGGDASAWGRPNL